MDAEQGILHAMESAGRVVNLIIKLHSTTRRIKIYEKIFETFLKIGDHSFDLQKKMK